MHDQTPTPAPVPPDTKDWTGVITQGCAECGFQPRPAALTGDLLRRTIPLWGDVLRRDDVRQRPAPTTWSPLEYGCHVRDVCQVFRHRLHLMLEQDDPGFPNWDQDKAAVADGYHEQDPDVVADEFADRANRLAICFDDVEPDQWSRRGTRSNGSHFTVETLAVYFLHDVVHHLHDVGVADPTA